MTRASLPDIFENKDILSKVFRVEAKYNGLPEVDAVRYIQEIYDKMVGLTSGFLKKDEDAVITAKYTFTKCPASDAQPEQSNDLVNLRFYKNNTPYITNVLILDKTTPQVVKGDVSFEASKINFERIEAKSEIIGDQVTSKGVTGDIIEVASSIEPKEEGGEYEIISARLSGAKFIDSPEFEKEISNVNISQSKIKFLTVEQELDTPKIKSNVKYGEFAMPPSPLEADANLIPAVKWVTKYCERFANLTNANDFKGPIKAPSATFGDATLAKAKIAMKYDTEHDPWSTVGDAVVTSPYTDENPSLSVLSPDKELGRQWAMSWCTKTPGSSEIPRYDQLRVYTPYGPVKYNGDYITRKYQDQTFYLYYSSYLTYFDYLRLKGLKSEANNSSNEDYGDDAVFTKSVTLSYYADKNIASAKSYYKDDISYFDILPTGDTPRVRFYDDGTNAKGQFNIPLSVNITEKTPFELYYKDDYLFWVGEQDEKPLIDFNGIATFNRDVHIEPLDTQKGALYIYSHNGLGEIINICEATEEEGKYNDVLRLYATQSHYWNFEYSGKMHYRRDGTELEDDDYEVVIKNDISNVLREASATPVKINYNIIHNDGETEAFLSPVPNNLLGISLIARNNENNIKTELVQDNNVTKYYLSDGNKEIIMATTETAIDDIKEYREDIPTEYKNWKLPTPEKTIYLRKVEKDEDDNNVYLYDIIKVHYTDGTEVEIARAPRQKLTEPAK